jgi:uncharacterized protein
MSNQYVRSPHEICAVGDVVTVWVLSIDLERRRVSLTMLDPAVPREQTQRRPQSTERKPAPAPKPAAQPAPEKPVAAAPAPERKPPKPDRPAKPAPKLSTEAAEGRVPLRGFDELKQLWNQRR